MIEDTNSFRNETAPEVIMKDKKKPKTLLDTPLDKARVAFSEHDYFLPFLLLTVLFTIVEPILVAFPIDRPYILLLQRIVLGVSTGLMVIGHVAQALFMEDQFYTSESGENVIKKIPFESKLFQTVDGESGIEVGSIILGWVFISNGRYGLACLRCLRVFRLLWYFELIPHEREDNYEPEEHMFSVSKSATLCILYLERLGLEFFSEKSRGGAVVLLIYFFTCFLFGVIFWHEAPGVSPAEGPLCAELVGCCLVMFRLSLYDGVGLDFLQAVIATGAAGLSVLLFLFLIFTAIILLNGLIGIFGNAFAAPESEDDEEIQEGKDAVVEEVDDNFTEEKSGAISSSVKEEDVLMILSDILNDMSVISNNIATLQDDVRLINTVMQ